MWLLSLKATNNIASGEANDNERNPTLVQLFIPTLKVSNNPALVVAHFQRAND